MLTVVGYEKSRTFRVLWALEELGLDYQWRAEAPQSAGVRALNPSGKIPVLLVDDAVLTDSTAIVTYLADREGRLTHPAGTLERARQDGLTLLLLDEFDALLWTAARHSFVLPEDRRVPAVNDTLRWEFARHADALADRLGGPFLAGDTFTIADIVCAHCLTWAIAVRFEIGPPPLRDYLDRMRARPGWQRAAARRS